MNGGGIDGEGGSGDEGGGDGRWRVGSGGGGRGAAAPRGEGMEAALKQCRPGMLGQLYQRVLSPHFV